MRALGRLLRLSLAPSAVADGVAGALFAATTHAYTFLAPGSPRVLARFPLDGAALAWLAAGSLCVYHGGMALNDWSDRAADAKLRPDRPIPSGRIAPGSALALALVLLAAGPLCAFRAEPVCGALLAAVALLAIVYDLAGRGAWRGPLLLAACRMGNAGAGVALGLAIPAPGRVSTATFTACLAALLLYGAYVFCVSRVGRLEDQRGALGSAPRAWIGAALAALALVTLLPGPGGPYARGAAAFVVALALVAPLKLVLHASEWTHTRVLGAMGMLLRRLLVFTAVLALLTGWPYGVITAALIGCGYPLSFGLRRLFPPS